MRRIARVALPTATERYLKGRQKSVDDKIRQRILNIEREWKSARQTKAIKTVLTTLQNMMGTRQRCMYCMDSHGADIEHFRPKATYPRHIFRWVNLLLCCTECGRFKGDRFPMADRHPLLIDPTREDPWLYLDFDPDTGNITARFDTQTNDWSPKGSKTVEILQFDRREALSAGYLRTFQRLSKVVTESLAAKHIAAQHLIDQLKDADDHGLLGWCFHGTGQNMQPFSDLRDQHPEIWGQCESVF